MAHSSTTLLWSGPSHIFLFTFIYHNKIVYEPNEQKIIGEQVYSILEYATKHLSPIYANNTTHL